MQVKKYSQLFIILLLVGTSLWQIVGIPDDEKEYQYSISIIIRGKMDESWSNLKKGAEDAAEDLKVNLRFVAAIEGNTAEEQKELLEKEAEGTDAILIAPTNRILMEQPILEMSKKKPIVLFESGISKKNTLPMVSCDNISMGRDLAKNIINYGNRKKKILVFAGNTLCSSISNRQRGFMQGMEETENSCTIVNAGSFQVKAIREILEQREPDVVVALETKILENLTKAVNLYRGEDKEKKIQVYGIGCSSEVLKYLENHYITAIVAQDDFSIGYLGVQEAVAAIEGKKVEGNQNIRYILTNSSRMYDDTNQRLLFPFVR